MPALRKLTVSNYKSLRRVAVPLGPLNVLVGPNESGKSNFLDVIRFLGDSVREDLQPAIDRRGGMDRLRFRGAESGTVSLSVEANVTQYSSETAPDEYTLSFWTRRSPRGSQILYRHESFRFKRTRGRGRRITIEGAGVEIIEEAAGQERIERTIPLRRDSLGLSTLPRLAPEEGGSEITRMATLFSEFRVFDVDVSRTLRPNTVEPSPTLSPDASNLSAFLLHLSKSNHDVFTQLENDARSIVPGLREINFEFVVGPDEGVSVVLEEEGLKGTTRLREVSYGTVRALALLAMLYDQSPPQLTCVEEIDHGLHPYVFDLIVERLREASERTQFLIVTHSPALVNRLRSAELIVCERDPETGESRIPAIDPELVQQIENRAEGKLRLGEIWFTGTLGGVPR